MSSLNSPNSFNDLNPLSKSTEADTPQSSSKISELLQKYGKIGLITHLSISWSIFGLTYLIIGKTKHSETIINKLNLQSKIPKSAGNFVISGVIYKAIMPARIGLSLMVIPFVANYF